MATYPYDKAPWWMNASVITQTGYVFTEIPANRAGFSATFLTTDDDINKAQAKATDQTRALQQALARLGKDAVRVTTSFSMRALYEEYRDKSGNLIEDQRADKINGYQVSLTLNVEIRDMTALEKAYALVLAATPTSASDINFTLQPSNETQYLAL
ncbi:MAG: SIMPL domain-containing protein [Asticcacaulis sp.]